MDMHVARGSQNYKFKSGLWLPTTEPATYQLGNNIQEDDVVSSGYAIIVDKDTKLDEVVKGPVAPLGNGLYCVTPSQVVPNVTVKPITLDNSMLSNPIAVTKVNCHQWMDQWASDLDRLQRDKQCFSTAIDFVEYKTTSTRDFSGVVPGSSAPRSWTTTYETTKLGVQSYTPDSSGWDSLISIKQSQKDTYAFLDAQMTKMMNSVNTAVASSSIGTLNTVGYDSINIAPGITIDIPKVQWTIPQIEVTIPKIDIQIPTFNFNFNFNFNFSF